MRARIYFDNAATTPLRPEALEAMLPFMRDAYANPSSPHSSGQRVRHALDDARERIAAALGALPDEVVVTAGGSEATNLALFGIMEAGRVRGRHIVTCATEHHATLHAVEALRARGCAVTIVDVDADGAVSVETLVRALRDDTVLVSIHYANNEIGTIQRVADLALAARARGALFHTDAVQAVGHVPVDLRSLGVDALSLSAHKFEGPKGVGALLVRRGVRVEPLVFGGGQEGGRRSGTENVAGIVGMATALELAVRELPSYGARVTAMRDRLIDAVLARIPNAHLNGARHERLPNNASLRFDGVDGATVVLQLDLAGVEVSTGSACTSGSLLPSHVLTALGLSAAQARGTVRFSLGAHDGDDAVDYVLDVLPGAIERLRALDGSFVR